MGICHTEKWDYLYKGKPDEQVFEKVQMLLLFLNTGGRHVDTVFRELVTGA